ncbi:uncharacterized protein Pyn_38806 [Prunus yedoensis var. nudiflora]|uniref:Uncharacterized protein n=1 Tax=Prunus yedoensis var. nudiflora TaxID=2094558 RepID=A0A314Z0T7_PRUYE|nr:uncharacterized protein Pyn_38806 [Prunus yedoensis var. nudiflora]
MVGCRMADVSTHSGTVSMDDGAASRSLAKEVIQAVTPTPPPAMENGINDTNKEVAIEEGTQEDMVTVLLDPGRRVQLPAASSGVEKIAFIAQNSDPFNFMPIIERTAGKVKGRGRGRPRWVGVVSASPSAQGVSMSSIKRKRSTAHHDIGDCEQARSVVPGKRRLCDNEPTEQAKEASLEGPPRLFQIAVYFNLSSQARLDRGFGNLALLQRWGNFISNHLVAFSSNHPPILITSDNPHVANNRLPKGRRRFQFEEAWTTEADCSEVVRQSWQSMVAPIHNIANCASRLTRWSVQKFGQVPRKVKELRVRLGNLQSEPSSIQTIQSPRL